MGKQRALSCSPEVPLALASVRHRQMEVCQPASLSSQACNSLAAPVTTPLCLVRQGRAVSFPDSHSSVSSFCSTCIISDVEPLPVLDSAFSLCCILTSLVLHSVATFHQLEQLGQFDSLVVLLNSFCIHQVSLSCHAYARTWPALWGSGLGGGSAGQGAPMRRECGPSRHVLGKTLFIEDQASSVRESWFSPRNIDLSFRET